MRKHEHVGIHEIAERLGTSRQWVYNLMDRDSTFPKPVSDLPASRPSEVAPSGGCRPCRALLGTSARQPRNGSAACPIYPDVGARRQRERGTRSPCHAALRGQHHGH